MDCCDDRSACRRSTALFLLFIMISLLACSPLARSRQTITTVAPICASASAVAFPIPELAPVTMQIFPCRLLFTVGMMRSFPSSHSSAPPGTCWPALPARCKGGADGKGARRNHDVDRPGGSATCPRSGVSTQHGVTEQLVVGAMVSNSLENGGSFN